MHGSIQSEQEGKNYITDIIYADTANMAPYVNGGWMQDITELVNSTGSINPLHTNLYRKSLSLRKTKTDKVDAHTIATMLMSDVNLKSYSDISYHNEELKSLTRYRFDKVKERAKLKSSVSRLVTILFPELEQLVPAIHMASIYALLSEFPSASAIAHSHLTRLTHLLSTASKGHYGKDTAILFREAARTSIGSHMPAKSLELKHTIKLIQEITSEIDEIEADIKSIMDSIHSPILTIPGISYRMGAMIIAEIGDFSRFDAPDKILAYAGMSPSTYQSGQLESSYSHMEKRGSIVEGPTDNGNGTLDYDGTGTIDPQLHSGTRLRFHHLYGH